MNPKGFLTYVINTLVDVPDCFDITDIQDEKGTLFTVTLPSSEAGRLIGKKGATVDAIRTVLRALGGKDSSIYYLKIEVS